MKIDKIKQRKLTNGLHIVATPIGNLGDLSKRAIVTLQEADLIICENKKHSLKLLNNLGIKKKLISLHDHNEVNIINKILKFASNKKIALITDAGSPLISDPGFKLVKHFIDKNYFLTSIPGPSSIICSLQISGIPINNFSYHGFAPKQGSKRNQFFDKIKKTGLTSVFFVSSKNLEKCLKNIIDIIGQREIAVCKEITKLNETVFRGPVNDIYNNLREKKINLKGEFTIVLSGEEKNSKEEKNINNTITEGLTKLLKKYSLTETVRIVHKLTSISKKTIYQKAIKIKNA